MTWVVEFLVSNCAPDTQWHRWQQHRHLKHTTRHLTTHGLPIWHALLSTWQKPHTCERQRPSSSVCWHSTGYFMAYIESSSGWVGGWLPWMTFLLAQIMCSSSEGCLYKYCILITISLTFSLLPSHHDSISYLPINPFSTSMSFCFVTD